MTNEEANFKQKRRPNSALLFGILLIVLVPIVGLIYFSLNRSVESSTSTITDERLELDPYLGNPDAPVVIVEYAAYGCDSCRRWHEAEIVEQMLVEFPNLVKFVYRDMPIIMPAWSQEMAEVAQCALDQGQEAFWLLHNALYSKTRMGRTTQAEAVQMGIDLGLDTDALQSCVESGTHYQTVRYDMQRSQAQGIRGTPTWFVNGQLVYNASSERLREMIEIELSGLSG